MTKKTRRVPDMIMKQTFDEGDARLVVRLEADTAGQAGALLEQFEAWLEKAKAMLGDVDPALAAGEGFDS